MNPQLSPDLPPRPFPLDRRRSVAATDGRQVCALTERRREDRRRQAVDLQHREVRLQSVAQASGIGAYDLDYVTGSHYFSPELKAIAGLPEDAGEMSLERVLEVVHPEDRERVVGKLAASLDPGGSCQLEDEYRLLRPDGTIRWVRAKGRTFFADDRGGRPLGATGFVIDITDRKADEDIRREQEEELKLALKAGHSGTFDWDARSDENHWSDELLALYGMRREEFGGRLEDWQECLVPEDREMGVAAVQDALLTGDFDIDFRIRRRDNGEVRWMSARAEILFDPYGKPLRMVGINVDITDRKRAEAEVESSRTRLAAILDSLNEGVVIFDLDGQVLDMNPAALRLLHYRDVSEARLRLPQFAETLDLRSMDGRSLPLHEWPIGRVVGGESFSGYDVEVRRKDDGSSQVISYNGTPVRGADGKAILGVLTMRNVSDQKQAERALQESERRLAVALQANGSAVWEIDVAGGTVRGENLLFTMLGYAPGELNAVDDWIALVHQDDRPLIPDRMAEVIRGQRDGYRFELRLRAKDGSWRWILSQMVAAERDVRGEAVRLVGTHTDITERKMAEAKIRGLNALLEQRVLERTAELRRANDALLRSNMELRHFAHAAAHDLQTPLRSIAGFAQLLRQEIQGPGNERIDEWSSQVIDNARRLQTLIQELLAYTRLDIQGLPFAPVNLRQLFDEVKASLATLIDETGAVVSCGSLPTAFVDRTQIAQVLQNLIENAIKYNQSQPPRVTIACERQEDEWVCSVADNGIGIDPKHHERIFEIFRRLHSYGQVPGTGIGLALCRRIVERHGGRIWVESRPGEGSTFHFTLPVRTPGV